MTKTMSPVNGQTDEQPILEKRRKRGSHPRWVPVAHTKVSPQAQRELKKSWVEHIAQNFDPDEVGLPVVSWRDGFFWVIDGQHRIEAMKLMGWADQQILCECFEGLTEAEEAEKFLKRQDRLPVAQLESFKSALTAGREVESDIDRIARALNIRIGGGSKTSISAVGTLGRVYRRGGPGTLSRTLRVIRDSYGGAGFSAAVINGVALVIQRFDATFDDDVAVERLSKAMGGVQGLDNRARYIKAQIGKPLAQCFAAAVVETLNAGRGGKKLPDWWK